MTKRIAGVGPNRLFHAIVVMGCTLPPLGGCAPFATAADDAPRSTRPRSATDRQDLTTTRPRAPRARDAAIPVELDASANGEVEVRDAGRDDVLRDAEPGASSDAAEPDQDASNRQDAGAAQDAGDVVDEGGLGDAGAFVDAGADSGASADAAAEHDAGSGDVDAGWPPTK